MSDPTSSDDLGADPTMLRPAAEGAALFDELDFEKTIIRTQTERRVFARYVLGRELGRGGMGIVWFARDEMLETEVALKFLPDSVARDREALADLKRETLRSRELRHLGIVGVYEFVQDAASAAIVMEYIAGPTLSELKTEQPGGCFDVAEIAPWIKQLCAVLTYAHEHARVVHRDLKPRNLMLSATKSLKVADFGISRSVSDSMSRLSMREHTSGTPPYMSPQQDTGETPSTSDDIYALGATIYDLLTSKPPFHSGNISKQIHEKIPPPMAERRLELGVQGKALIPSEWERLVAACLAKKPEERPRSAAECLQWIGGRPVSLARANPLPQLRRPVLMAAAAMVFLVSGFAVWKASSPKTLLSEPTARSATPPPLLAAASGTSSPAPPEVGQTLSLEKSAITNMLSPQEFPSPPAAAIASNSAAPASSSAAKKRIVKSTGDKSGRESGSSGPNDSMRRSIEKQYREGNLTRDQYLNAIKNQ